MTMIDENDDDNDGDDDGTSFPKKPRPGRSTRTYRPRLAANGKEEGEWSPRQRHPKMHDMTSLEAQWGICLP